MVLFLILLLLLFIILFGLFYYLVRNSIFTIKNKTYKYKKTDFPIEFVLSPKNIPKNYSYNIVENLIQIVIQEFNTESNFNFFMYKSLTEEFNIKIDGIIGFERKNHKLDHDQFDDEGPIYAHATLPPYREICLDSDNNWNDKFIRGILKHELGHILGLIDLINKQPSIMCNAVKYQKLQPLDIQYLQKLYPFIKP